MNKHSQKVLTAITFGAIIGLVLATFINKFIYIFFNPETAKNIHLWLSLSSGAIAIIGFFLSCLKTKKKKRMLFEILE